MNDHFPYVYHQGHWLREADPVSEWTVAGVLETILAFIAMAICLLAVMMLFLCGCSGWTRQDTYRQAGVIALSSVDWMQTRKIAQNPDKWYERNPILGKHPSTAEVDLWFAGSIAANTAIAAILPPKYRPYWQYLSIGWEGVMIGNNLSIGLGFGF